MTTRYSTRLMLFGALLLGSVLAQGDASLSARIAAMAGHHLTFAQTQERLQTLGTMLDGAGYGAVRTRNVGDGTTVSRWYHAGARHTALAFAGQAAEDNDVEVAELDGFVSMNEMIPTP